MPGLPDLALVWTLHQRLFSVVKLMGPCLGDRIEILQRSPSNCVAYCPGQVVDVNSAEGTALVRTAKVLEHHRPSDSDERSPTALVLTSGSTVVNGGL